MDKGASFGPGSSPSDPSPAVSAHSGDDPSRVYRCCGCGAPLELGEYRSCDCPTGVASNPKGKNDHIIKKPRCAWCNAVPTAHNLDGDDLCFACCNKWAHGEGIAAADDDEGAEYIPNRLRNYATICEAKGLLVEASGLRDFANILSPILARNAERH